MIPPTNTSHLSIKFTWSHFQHTLNCSPIELQNGARMCSYIYIHIFVSRPANPMIQLSNYQSVVLEATISFSDSFKRYYKRRKFTILAIPMSGENHPRVGLFLHAIKTEGRLRGSHVMRYQTRGIRAVLTNDPSFSQRIPIYANACSCRTKISCTRAWKFVNEYRFTDTAGNLRNLLSRRESDLTRWRESRSTSKRVCTCALSSTLFEKHLWRRLLLNILKMFLSNFCHSYDGPDDTCCAWSSSFGVDHVHTNIQPHRFWGT